MTDHIVGMFWNQNEGDILEETIEAALGAVDSLFIADDGSTDGSPGIVASYQRHPKVELAACHRKTPKDKGQRTFLLNEIRKRYKPENTWVQLIESDILLLDTDIRDAVSHHAVHDLAMSWMTLNACRLPGTWKSVDTYPNWTCSMRKLMPVAHWMEFMLYTFRPLPKLYYDSDVWRPWPKGFAHYTTKQVKGAYGRKPDAPLLLHVGNRGPTHFWSKYRSRWKRHPKYTTWDLTSPTTVEETVSFFNGEWNGRPFEASRKGWVKWRTGK